MNVWLLTAVTKIRRGLFIQISLLLFSQDIMCQCPDNVSFRNRINSIYNTPKLKNQILLKRLLEIESQMKICHIDKDSCFAFLLQKIGVTYYRQGNFEDAIKFTRQSISIANECMSNRSFGYKLIVDNYYNLYYYYGQTENLEKKYEAIDSCISNSIRGNDGFEMAITPLEEKTEYLFNIGEYSLCSKNAKLGEQIIQKYYHEKDSITYIVFFITKQANALYYLKNISSAKKLLFDKISQFKSTGNSKHLGSFYTLVGLINRDTKNYNEALYNFQAGYSADSSIKYKKGCAQNLTYMGALFAKYFGNANNGLRFCRNALKYADGNDSQLIYKEIANIYVSKGMYREAQRVFQRSFNSIENGLNENSILKAPLRYPGFNLYQNLSDLLTSKADAYLQEYRYSQNKNLIEKALVIYKKNDLYLERIKTDQNLNFASNLVWRSTARALYEHAIEACYSDYNIEDAFYFFERSRATLLNGQLNERRRLTDSDIAKQNVLKRAIFALEDIQNNALVSSDEHLKVEKILYSKNEELSNLNNRIRNKNPQYYRDYLDTSFITLKEVRRSILTDAKNLLEIFDGDSAVYVLTITNNKQSLHKMDKNLYDSLTKNYIYSISNRNILNKHFKDFVTTSHSLYKLIFKSIVPGGNIIISPDGQGYPFEALVMNDNTQQPDYLLNHYVTSYTYSANYLITKPISAATSSNSVLGIAPVQYNYNQNLAELSGSDKSLEIINNYFNNAANFTFEKATKNTFLQTFPNYKIIQLYTHASDTSNENDPVIYFSDSALYLSSLIPDRKPVTQLVVLSACETANGKLYEGEGIFSFNRAFAALGIPAAVSNLWSVDNKSTYRITELFYKYLSQGFPTDVALQKAKLEFINTARSEERKLPYFWAACILTGRVDILKTETAFPWLKLAGITFSILILTYSIRRFLNRSNKKNSG